MHEDHSHVHDHTHPHDHSHEHSDSQCCHDHSYEDLCCHSHNHADLPTHSGDETVALLNYMIDHNKHHGEDLHEIYHALINSGKAEAAELVHSAMHEFDHGNEKLAEALKLIGG